MKNVIIVVFLLIAVSVLVYFLFPASRAAPAVHGAPGNEAVRDGSEAVKQGVQSGYDATKDAAKSGYDATKDAVKDGYDATKDATHQAVDAVKDAAK